MQAAAPTLTADSAGEPSTACVEEPCRPCTAESAGPSRVDEQTQQGPALHAEPAGGAGTSQDDSAEVSQVDVSLSRLIFKHDH